MEATQLRDKAISTLFAKYGGHLAAEYPSGTIDLLTSIYAIIVRPVGDWCGALGQALMSAMDTKKKPAIYLFDVCGDTLNPQPSLLLWIDEYLRKANVVLMNESHVYRPFDNVLTTEAIAGIIKAVLDHRIKAVKTLALNKRIYIIVDQMWPAIARSQLLITSPTSMNLSDICHAMLPLSTRLHACYMIRLQAVSMPYYPILDILNVVAYESQLVFIHYGNRAVFYKSDGNKYIPYNCEGISINIHRDYTGRSGIYYEAEIADWARPYVYADIKRMMTRVLPELVDSFVFPEDW